MRAARFTAAVIATLGFTAVATAADAKVLIDVNLDNQTIHVVSKDHVYDWKVSSGRPGYDTPVGTFKVLWMDKDHHSDEYEQAPMPNAIFFAPGYAIHGFTRSAWGHKASHGCVRLPTADAATLFDLVKSEGGADITITGASPVTMATVKAKLQEKNALADANGTGRYGDGSGYADNGTGYADNAGYPADNRYAAPPQSRYYDPYTGAPVQAYRQQRVQQPQQQPFAGLFGLY